jgi:Leucine rich repeat/Leucine Rich repeat
MSARRLLILLGLGAVAAAPPAFGEQQVPQLKRDVRPMQIRRLGGVLNLEHVGVDLRLPKPSADAENDEVDVDAGGEAPVGPLERNRVIAQVYLRKSLFQSDGTAEAARDRLQANLKRCVDTLSWAGMLSESQSQRLLLAGHGDLQHFFQRIEDFREALHHFPEGSDADDPEVIKQLERFDQECRPLKAKIDAGPFDSNSKLSKVLGRLLTHEQAAALEPFRNLIVSGAMQVQRPSEAIPGLRLSCDGFADMMLVHLLSLPHLNKLHEVTQIHLTASRVTNASLEKFAQLPRLEYLRLSGSHVTDAGLKALAGCPRLTWLLLGNTAISDNGIPAITGILHLEGLDLEHTQITDRGLEGLGTMTRLKYLDLSHTQVTDAGLEHLLGMAGLETLGLRGTQVTSETDALALQKQNPAMTERSITGLKRALPRLRIQGKR